MGKAVDWGIPAGLVVLSLVPVAAGTVRLLQIAGGVATAENARFLDDPVPAVLHLVAITVFSLLGAFQFAPRLRRALPRWHRGAGRLVVPCGLVAALSGMWMEQAYPNPPADGTALYVMRMVVGAWMTWALCTGYLAIRRREIAVHRDWMLRGYAIGMGAGTQVLTSLPFIIAYGPLHTGPRAVLLGAGWVINVIVAEAIIRRRRTGRARPAFA